jgi:hypothetical protein
MTRATTDEIADLLGDDVDEAFIERIASVGPSVDELGEAIDDLDYERRYGETREASSHRVEETRSILEELREAASEEPDAEDDEEQHDGLRVVEADELGPEAP